MFGSKLVRWKKLSSFVFATVLFVVAGLSAYAPQASAAAVYTWTDATHVHVIGFDHPQNSGDNAEFDMTCSGVAPNYNCVGSSNGSDQANYTGPCAPRLVFSGDSSTATLQLQENKAFTGQPVQCAAVTPQITGIKVAGTDKAPTDLPNKTDANGGTEDGSDVQDPELECGTSYNPLVFLLCPLVTTIINGLVAGLDNLINNLLLVDQKKIFDTSTQSGNAYHQAWQVFRSFALAVLVIGGLIMVIAQGLGFQILDAYTVKKVLPRLVIAIIGITLSWELMKFFVGFTNDVGLGIRKVIYYPFQALYAGKDGYLSLGGGASTVIALITGGAILALGIGGLLALAATAALGAIIAYLVLVIRQLVIIFLVLVAPLAIALSILPNTQGAYKLWHESFTKAMMMFPIIVAFIAIGRVFAITAVGSDIGTVDASSQLIGFAAYFLPYYLIPLTFRFAGGALRTIGGAVNDRSRGGFDRLKKYRGGRIQTNMHNMKTGNRMKGNSIVARGFNKATSTVAAVPGAGIGVNPTKWRDRVRSNMSNNSILEAAEYGEKNHAFAAIKGNDDFLEAGRRFNGNEAEMTKYLRSKGYDENDTRAGVADIRAARRDVSNEVFDTAAVLALPGTGTAFKGGAGEMNEAVHEVAGNKGTVAARMLAQMRGSATQARRPDLAGGGYGDQLKTYQEQISGVITSAQASSHIRQSALEGQGGNYIVGARKSVVESMAPVMMSRLEQTINAQSYTQTNPNGTTSPMATSADVDRELATLAGRYDAMAQIAPENARVMAERVMGQSVADPSSGNNITVQALIDSRRNQASFQEMRREYASASVNAAANAAQIPAGGAGGPTPGATPGTP